MLMCRSEESGVELQAVCMIRPVAVFGAYLSEFLPVCHEEKSIL